MKWDAGINYHEPYRGDKRTRHIFAIFPHTCTDGMTRWLEKVTVEEIYLGRTACGEYWKALAYHPLENIRQVKN